MLYMELATSISTSRSIIDIFDIYISMYVLYLSNIRRRGREITQIPIDMIHIHFKYTE